MGDWSRNPLLDWYFQLLLLCFVRDLTVQVLVEPLLLLILAPEEEETTWVLLVEVVQLYDLIDGQLIVAFCSTFGG